METGRVPLGVVQVLLVEFSHLGEREINLRQWCGPGTPYARKLECWLTMYILGPYPCPPDPSLVLLIICLFQKRPEVVFVHYQI